MTQPRQLDSSLRNRIETPTPTFQAFLQQYFDEPIYGYRREEDRTLIDRLNGEEQRVALEMIRTNLATAREHILRAAVLHKMPEAIPVLRSMMGQSGPEERVFPATLLYDLGRLSADDLFGALLAAIPTDDSWLAHDITYTSISRLALGECKQIIQRMLEVRSYDVRAAACQAALTLHYIARHGGQYTPQLHQEAMALQTRGVMIDSPHPTYYEQLQYYAGDATFSDRATFERRIRELWDGRYTFGEGPPFIGP